MLRVVIGLLFNKRDVISKDSPDIYDVNCDLLCIHVLRIEMHQDTMYWMLGNIRNKQTQKSLFSERTPRPI